MTFRQFAFNNVLRNKRLYAAYFLSSLFTVMVFFTFANFAFHPSLSADEMRSSVLTGMMVAGGIIYVFSFFFILYSMSSFLQSRKKEFGILMVQGMSTSQIRKMVFLENMLIGSIATMFGITIGIIFSKAILLIAENLLVIDGKLQFYFPYQATLITFSSFIILFFFISIFVTFILRTNKLVRLIKGDKIGKSEPAFSKILVIMAILFLGIGYSIALKVKGLTVVVALLPVALLVTVGTYLLFTQLSVFIIRRLKANDTIFWKKTNMLLFSDLSYRMKDNARSFFIVAIISTVAFSAIGTLVSLNSFITKGIIEANPASFTYYADENADEKTMQQDINIVEGTLKDHKIKTEKKSITLQYYSINDSETPVLIANVADYNEYASFYGENTIEISNDEAIVVKRSLRFVSPPGWDEQIVADLPLATGEKLVVNREMDNLAKPDILPEMFAYYIVSEDAYNKLPDPVQSSSIHHWQAIGGKNEAIIEAGRSLEEKLPYNVTSVDYVVHGVKMVYSPIMFVGLFIGIIFFVSAGSFLYFRLYTDLDDDKAKFKAISKIGLTKKELQKVITRQTAILFFTPITVAMIHGAVALTALAHMFEYNLVNDAIIVLSCFFIIQTIYFFVVRYFYTKQIEKAIY